jgi:hypothetical protein
VPRVEPLDEALDRPALARGVRPLDHDDHAALGVFQRVLQLQQAQMAVLHFLPVFFRCLAFRLVEIVEADRSVGGGHGHGLEIRARRGPGASP